MLGHPLPPPRLPVQTDSRRLRSSEASAVLTTPELIAPRRGRDLPDPTHDQSEVFSTLRATRWAGPSDQTRKTNEALYIGDVY